MTSYVYMRTEAQLFTVGFYDPAGVWHSESDHDSKEEASKRVHWLNGGCESVSREDFEKRLAVIERRAGFELI